MVTLSKIAQLIEGTLVGDGTTVITGVAGIAEAKTGDITFLTSRKYVKFLELTEASAVIAGEDIAPDSLSGRNIIVTKNPVLAQARVAELFQRRPVLPKGVDPLASVSPDAVVAEDATVGPFAYVGHGATVGPGAVIHPYAYVGERAVIGQHSVINPNVTIYHGVIIGARVTIQSGSVIGSDGFGYVWDGTQHRKIPQLGIVEIEDDVEIGANVTIDRASLGKTVIGRGSRIDNLVQIAHNVRIGRNSVIVAQVGIAGSSTVGDNTVMAGQVGVADHVTIGNNVRVAGKTGVMVDVPDNSTIAGSPHLPHREWLRIQSYIRKLPELFESMKRMEKRLKEEGTNG